MKHRNNVPVLSLAVLRRPRSLQRVVGQRYPCGGRTHGLRRSQRQRGLRAIGTERRSLAVTAFVRSESCTVLFASKRFMSLASGVSLWKGKGNRRSPSAPLEEAAGAAEKRARGPQSRDANHHASHTGGGSCQRGPAKPGRLRRVGVCVTWSSPQIRRYRRHS